MTIARVAYGSREGQRIERESEKGTSLISILRKEKESREHTRKCLMQAASRLRKSLFSDDGIVSPGTELRVIWPWDLVDCTLSIPPRFALRL